MKKHDFERQVLDLWVTTRIPMTRAALQYHTGAPRRRLERWLEEIVADGVLELDSDPDGELLYTVPGADRPARGPRTFAEAKKLDDLSAQIEPAGRTRPEGRESSGGPAGRRGAARKAPRSDKRRRKESAAADDGEGLDWERHKEQALMRLRDTFGGGGALEVAGAARREIEGRKPPSDKSILLSTGLSLFFGPLGWLYAGAWREALPASAAYLLVLALIPTFLLLPLMPIAMGASGIAGLVYAWQHNKAGERTPILGPGSDD